MTMGPRPPPSLLEEYLRAAGQSPMSTDARQARMEMERMLSDAAHLKAKEITGSPTAEAQIIDPPRLAATVAETVAKIDSEPAPPSFFDRTLGRAAGAIGRGALGAGRFAEEGVAPLGQSIGRSFGDAAPVVANALADPASGRPTNLGMGLEAADALSKTGGAVVAENIAPLVRGLSPGPNSFDSFIGNLRDRQEAMDLFDALTMQANRDAFRETKFPPGVAPLLEAVGDVTNVLPIPGVGAAARGAARGAGELAQGAATAARQAVPDAQTVKRGLDRISPVGVADAAASRGEFDELEELRQRVDEITARIEVASENTIERPRWARGRTDQELIDFAREHGVNPYEPEWDDALDPEVVKDFLGGSGKQRNAGGRAVKTITALRKELPQLRARIRELDASRGPGGTTFERNLRTGEVEQLEELDLSAPPVAAPAAAPPPDPVLPRDLRGAKPRWKDKTPTFASDVDRALYIIGNEKTRSRRHDDYVAFLRPVFGDVNLVQMGRDVRKRVSDLGKSATGSTFNVPAMSRTAAAAPPPQAVPSVPRLQPASTVAAADTGPLVPQPPVGPVPVQGALNPPRPSSGPPTRLPPDDRGTMPGMGGMDVPRRGVGENVIGLRAPTIKPLGRVDELHNRVVDLLGKPHLRREETVKAAFGERRRVQPVISNLAGNIGTRAQSMVEEAFQLDDAGRLADLSGIDPSIKGAPTIQDVAARLPHYRSHLEPQQVQVLERLRDAVSPYRKLLEETGVKIEGRGDIVEGGFYLPRGRAGAEGADEAILPSARKIKGGKRGFEKTAQFKSQAEGIDAGFSYPSIGETLRAYATDAGKRSTDSHIARFLRGQHDEAGRPLARVTGKKLPGETQAPGTRERGSISLYGLQGVTFPDEIANAAENILRREGRSMGKFSGVIDTANALNNMYRTTRATLDNSALAIQGLVGLANDQKAYGKAFKVNVQVWFSKPHKARVLGRFVREFDGRAQGEGMPSSQDWARYGLRFGGDDTGEFGQSIITKVPLISRANRAFGAFGDALRLEWANDELAVAMKNRTLDEMRQSGDIEQIARIANNMTGWTEGKAFGDWGDMLLFAPRFLQARLDTVAKAAMGMVPGATLEQRIARKSMLRMVGWATLVTVAANEAMGNETDFRPVTMVNGRPRYNSNFMRIRALGRDWSMLGTWDSLARAIITTAAGEPDNEIRGRLEGVRGLGGGITSNAWDFLTGEGFGQRDTGRPLHHEPDKIVRRLLENVMPFSASDAPETFGDIVGGLTEGDPGRAGRAAVGAGSEMVGVKASPLSFIDFADPIARQKYSKPYDQLNDDQRKAVGKLVAAQNPFLGTEDPDVLAWKAFGKRYSDLDKGRRKWVDETVEANKKAKRGRRQSDVEQPPISGGVSPPSFLREMIGR